MREKRKIKAKKTKAKILTDKEREDFARRHWDKHHGKGEDKSEDSCVWAAAADIPDESDKWTAAADIPDSSMEDDTPQPLTPHSVIFHGHTNPTDSDHTHNFPPTLSPIVTESVKTFF